MRLNEKNVASFAVCSSPIDKEGYLQKKGDLNRDFQRRWFILKGNLLFYFLKKQDREPQGVIVLEACSVQVSHHGRYCFDISFDGAGTRTYVLGADNDDEMQSWMKAISHASYDYLKTIVAELQKRVDYLTSSSAQHSKAQGMDILGAVGSGSPTSRPKSTVKETSVTLQELSNPTAPQMRSPPTTKIKKGILVDIDQEAPPIPIKKKSLSMHGSHHRGERRTHNSDDEQIEDRKSSFHESLTFSHHRTTPHSSPLIPSVPVKGTLSPPSTMDRTPVLQPMAPGAASTSPVTPQTLDTAMMKLSVNQSGDTQLKKYHNGMETEGPGLSTHPHQVTRKVAAPPIDPSKSFIEMHKDFTQAMKELNADRTSNPAPS